MSTDLRLAVIGHIEWVDFIRVKALPRPGEIIHAPEALSQPAGGGAVVAAQLAKLAGRCTFFTSLGRDALGEESVKGLEALGVDLHVAWRDVATRRAVTFVDAAGERTITVVGERLMPTSEDRLPWDSLGDYDGVFVTTADPEGFRRARAARVLASTPRAELAVLEASGVRLDALIGSALDATEAVGPGDLSAVLKLVIRTEGAEGGSVQLRDGSVERFSAPALPGPIVDTYGAGDSFAAGVTYGLAAGMSTQEAVALGCRCGAGATQGAGAYEGQRGLSG